MTVRVGLLGASKIAPRAVLDPGTGRADVEVVAVAARDPDRARAYAGAHGVPEVAADYAALVAREDLDLIYNGLPPALHRPWTEVALEAGKAVLCEKPFALSALEAQAMVETAGRTGRLLIEAYHYRHHRVMHDAVALVRSGALGRPLRAEARFDVPIARTATELRWQAALGGGALMDLGCYPLHALRSLLGTEPEVLSVEAAWVDGVDAALSAELDFGGVPGRIACSMVAETPGARLSVICEGGGLEIVNFIAPQIGCRFSVTRDGRAEAQAVEGPTTYEAQLEHVLQRLRGGAEPLVEAAACVAQMRAIDRIYAAAGRPRA